MRRSPHPRTTVLCLAWSAALGGCHGTAGHDHGEEHVEGHNHHEANHGHGDGPVVGNTWWTPAHEWFVEYGLPVVGQGSTFMVHLTRLEGFQAVSDGQVSLHLTGPETLTAKATKPSQPGIFVLEVKPSRAGRYRGRLLWTGGTGDEVTFDLDVVAKAPAEGDEGPAHDEDEGTIEFLKEQQWRTPFGTATVANGSITESLDLAGVVGTPPLGTAVVGAPVTGRVVALPAGLPKLGDRVRRGQVLARFAPSPATPEEGARAALAVAEAETRRELADAQLRRTERLFAEAAASLRELEEARREARMAREAVGAAQGAEELFASTSSGTGKGAWSVTAPIEGVIVEARATVGEPVGTGAILWRIVDPSVLWIRVRVPEQDTGKVRLDADAAVGLPGGGPWVPLRVSGPTPNASVVALGRMIDPVTRTADLLYALHEPPENLSINALVRVSVPTGATLTGRVVPRSALVEADGQTVVYVQVDGEHFEERSVSVGAVSGDTAAITAGLRDGERVVTVGAPTLRIASRANREGSHGHLH